MSGQVFISYRREGGDTMAYLLWDRLLSHGYRVFYDIDSLNSGRFDEKILSQIEQSSHVLVILPKGGLDRCKNEDDWVRREIAHAIEKGKTLIPIPLRGFDWPEDMPDAIRNLRNYQGVEMKDLRHFPLLLDDLEKLLGVSGPAMVAPADGVNRRVLFWSDLPKGDNESFIESLKSYLPDGCTPKALDNPLDILRQEQDDNAPDTIVLIVTDVTKFSSDEKARERLNNYLCSFVRQGGRLIC